MIDEPSKNQISEPISSELIPQLQQPAESLISRPTQPFLNKYLIAVIILVGLVTLGAIIVAAKNLFFFKPAEQPQVQEQTTEQQLSSQPIAIESVAKEHNIDGEEINPLFIPYILSYDFVSPFDARGANIVPINIKKVKQINYSLETKDGEYKNINVVEDYNGIYAVSSIPAENFAKFYIEKYSSADYESNVSANIANSQLIASRQSSFKLDGFKYRGHEYYNLDGRGADTVHYIRITNILFPGNNILTTLVFYDRNFLTDDQKLADYYKFLDTFTKKYIDTVISQGK